MTKQQTHIHLFLFLFVPFYRATAGPIVADKNCEKIHFIGKCVFIFNKKQSKNAFFKKGKYINVFFLFLLPMYPFPQTFSNFSSNLVINISSPNTHTITTAPNIYCCGAGTAADTEMTTALISSQLELLRLRTGTESRVVTCMTMLKRRAYKHQGHISAALVLGGVDCTGPHLYTVYPHGSTDKLPFVTMGSGSLAAMSVFECGYKDDMTEVEAKKLVRDAIAAGIYNDLGSGSNIDLCVIRTEEERGPGGEQIDFLRGYETPNNQGDLRALIQRPAASNFPRGVTNVKSSHFVPVRERVNVVDTTEEA